MIPGSHFESPIAQQLERPQMLHLERPTAPRPGGPLTIATYSRDAFFQAGTDAWPIDRRA